jgi:ATP-binding cassette, subfamily D (ALD), peroxisomal long-chain fatty acid import protein
LDQVENWKKRREEIEEELRKVMVEGGKEVAPPPYIEGEGEKAAEEEAHSVEGINVSM